jgi:hypothetical protein
MKVRARTPTLAAGSGDTLITNGSPSGTFSQNKQNEPAVAIDAHAPSVVAAGANEEIDDESCAAGNPTTCPFTPDVGTSGVYFSGNGGGSFTDSTGNILVFGIASPCALYAGRAAPP